jgi:prophage tail gpP-like protein
MDKVSLSVDNRALNNFTDLSISNSIYEPESSFEFVSKRPEFNIKEGSVCEVSINGIILYTGIIDTVSLSYSKSEITYLVSGRNILGLLSDDFITDFSSVDGLSLKLIVEKYIRKVPIISKKCNLIFGKNVAKLVAPSGEKDLWKPAPGDTVFSFIKTVCLYHGVLIYLDKMNNIVFDKPKVVDKPLYDIIISKQLDKFVNKSKVIKADISKSSKEYYNKIIIVGQSEDDDDFNISKVAYDRTAPIEKTLVIKKDNDKTASKYATQIIEQQRFNSNKITYIVSGYSQNGKIFEVNNFCNISDDFAKIKGTYLLYAATFTLSRSKVQTELEFGLPGVPQ